MFRKLTLCLVAALTALLRADTAVAIDQAACCLPTTSRLDSLMNPVQGGDEKFFSKTSGPPNILFIIDTSGSMHAWPTTWPTSKGCSHSFFQELDYKPNETYPRLWTDLDEQSTNWFATDKYYTAPDGGYGVAFQLTPNGTSWTKAADACTGVSTNTADRTLCQQCLDTKGYYIQDGTASKRRVKGNFLNFYAPRDSGAVKVLADVVRDLNGVRFSVMAYQSGNAQGCWGKKSNSAIGAQCLCMVQDMGPTCNKSYPLDVTAADNARDTFLRNLSNQNGPLNGLGWDACNTPLSDALYAAGYYFQSKSAVTPFTTFFGASHAKPADSKNFAADDGVCFECGFNAIILLTDGEPYDEGKILSLPAAIKNDPTPCDGCGSSSAMHKVAKYMWEHDLRADKDGLQSVATYTIGFSEDVSSSKLLQETARLGGGQFHSARSTSELKQAIVKILDNINTRSNAFSSAAVNTLQTQNTSALAIIPRMVPSRSKGWMGKLYRFEQFNEFVENQDKNGDGDRDDAFLVDKQGTPVAENAEGEFRKITAYSTASTPTVFGGKAEPFWEAGDKLAARALSTRQVFTVTDNGKMKGGAKDGLINQDDALVAVTLDNLTELRQYLGVAGAPLCPSGLGTSYRQGLILDKMKSNLIDATNLINDVKRIFLTPPVTQEGFDQLCAALLIQYARGQDLFDEDGDALRGEIRDSALGDIFHSTPVLVNPPSDRFLCDLGLSNQCVRTLYASTTDLGGTLATPLKTETISLTGCSGSGNKSVNAYDAYQFNQRMRQRLILVGANDGMLHAFRDGTGQEDSGCNVNYPVNSLNAGEEAWAFIPSDLLPRLQDMLQGHAYYVDGDIMVRDIWADDNKDGIKSANEFHTVAVVAEGRGGTHYFALNLQWASGAQGAAAAPSFRWMFPQPCSDEALAFGKTLFSLSGKAPPIGPVLLESTAGLDRYGTKAAERWVTMLSGGWSPAGEKGRGLYMVDVWNGQVNSRKDNLLWKWEYAAPGSTTNSGNKPREYMRYGFVSPVQLVDYGESKKVRFDGFFDTAVVGDLGGQLWTLRFQKPGVVGASGLVENWSGGRSFVMDSKDVDPGKEEDIRKHSPFFYSTEVAIQLDTKALRAFVGTGNRYSLLDEGVGTCRFDNPQACSKLGCGETQVDYRVSRNDTDLYQTGSVWTKQAYKEGGNSRITTPASYNYCGSTSNSSFIKGWFAKRETNKCTTPSSTNFRYDFASTVVTCGQSSTDIFDCRVKDTGNTLYMGDVDVKPTVATGDLNKNRFYGLWAYGGVDARSFDEDPRGVGAAQAGKFDERRLTDTGGVTGAGSLVNVTDVSCTLAGVCTCAAGSTTCRSAKPFANTDDYGWFYEYDGVSHKTASGASVLASCAVWNSMYSSAVVTNNPRQSAACSGGYVSKARLFQGDFITGAPTCAVGFKNATTFSRFLERDVVSPPADPALSIQVSKTGQVRYNTLFFEAGSKKSEGEQTNVSGSNDLLQYIYELPVPQSLHNCRHDALHGRSACVPSEL